MEMGDGSGMGGWVGGSIIHALWANALCTPVVVCKPIPCLYGHSYREHCGERKPGEFSGGSFRPGGHVARRISGGFPADFLCHQTQGNLWAKRSKEIRKHPPPNPHGRLEGHAKQIRQKIRQPFSHGLSRQELKAGAPRSLAAAAG